MELSERIDGSHTFLALKGSEEFATNRWFEPEKLAPGRIVGSAQGRGNSLFLRAGAHRVVLRRYRRAGLAARFSDDAYLWLGLARSRPYRELVLTARLHEMGLPVPQPLAARIERHGFFYRASLITRQIEGAKALCDCDEIPWEKVGETIALFHRAGLYHSDLNARNILIDEDGKVWLIDFDKCDFRQAHQKWHAENLMRLQRSLRKLGLYDDHAWGLLASQYSALTLKGKQ
jgi:3-deoxy-D-manno-octulosonic acid kinase